MLKNKKTKIGIVGCGAIGNQVAFFVDKKLKNVTYIHSLADSNRASAVRLQKKLKSHPKITTIDSLIKGVDLVVESASQAAAKYILKKAIAKEKDTVILSVGALLDCSPLIDKAKKKGIKIYVPSGAICGVDGLGALSLSRIKSVSLITSKSPRGLIGADYFKKRKINLSKIKKQKVVFKGKVKAAIKFFPKNINVAATLLLASNFKNITVCIKADPALKRNVHRIELKAMDAKLSIAIENVPSKDNPKTSALAILSTQHLLRKIFNPFKIGS